MADHRDDHVQLSARKKATKAKPVALATHDTLTGKAILEAAKCSRCTSVFFSNSLQPVTLPDGSRGYLCFADRQAAGIAKRTDKAITVIVCSRNGEVYAAKDSFPIRIPVESSTPDDRATTSAVVHMCPSCHAQAIQGPETAPPEQT